MKKVVLLIASFLFILPVAVFAEDTSMYSVFKLEAYSFDLKTNSYQLEQYGSSVYVSNGLLYTNAHVVLDIYDEPLNNYRACKTIDFKKQPECFSVAKLLYYDTSNDLAVLKISDPKVMTASLYHGDLEIGQKVKVYGYPGNGGETITYTEGSISGYEEGLYKIDATIDAGSSGGGVFDESGRLIGISVAVKIGYSTLGYIIPIETLQVFISKEDVESITEYTGVTDKGFMSFHILIRKALMSDGFSNHDVQLTNISKYGYHVSGYQIDVNKDKYLLTLSDEKKDNYVFISNTTTDVTPEVLYPLLKKHLLEEYAFAKEEGSIDAYRVRILKLGGKDTLLSFYHSEEVSVLSFVFYMSNGKYKSVKLTTTNIQSKGFTKGLKMVLRDLVYRDTDNGEGEIIAPLVLPKESDFTMLTNYGGDYFVSLDGDIEVLYDGGSISEKSIVYDTLSELAEFHYQYRKDYNNYVFYGIRQTKAGNPYIYQIIKNETSEDYKRYTMVLYMYMQGDDDQIYALTFQFDYDTLADKKKIDDYLDGLEFKNASYFTVGNLKIGENLVK